MIEITDKISIYEGDCIDVMGQFQDNAFDTLITDPPAGISMMAKQWDDLSGYQARTERGQVVMQSLKPLVELKIIQDWEAGFLLFTVDWAYSVLRILKPGASGLVWSIPRTSDLTQFGLRLAGFEVRDSVAHLFSVGFPKSHDISKHIDKHLGKDRKIIGQSNRGTGAQPNKLNNHGEGDTGIGYADGSGKIFDITEPATPESQKWQGWGTALKPAREDWILVQKPLDGTNAENALKWGVAGLNIDGARVPVENGESVTINRWDDGAKPFGGGAGHPYSGSKEVNGRWPANITHDGSPDVVENFPETGVSSGGRIGKKDVSGVNIVPAGNYVAGDPGFGDKGSAARFFYSAKANKAERDAGLDEIEYQLKDDTPEEVISEIIQVLTL